jgi:general secretion pathway protein N
MSSAPWRLTVVGVVLGAVLAVVVFAPAQWLAAGVAQATGARVQLLEPGGTVWSGSARLVLGAGSGSQAHTSLPGRLQWRLVPSLQGLQLGLRAPCCLTQEWVWKVTPSLDGMHLSIADQASVWPSELLAGLGTPWNTLQLKGTLALSTQQLSLQWKDQRWTIAGQVQLDASNMSTSLSTLSPLGSYRMQLTGGDVPTIGLSTLEGSLQLSGTGRWAAGRLQFDGEATAAPQREQALANLLNIIGQRDGARAILKVG